MSALITRQEAIAAGQRFYFNGVPCPQGHVAKRYTAKSKCFVCEQNRARARRDPEQSILQLRMYKARLRTPDKVHIWWASRALERARKRAQKQGVPCTIKRADIEAVLVAECPVLGILLDYGPKGGRYGLAESPSLDRIIPSLGYVPGNIGILSLHANQRKGTLTEVELANMLAYVRGF